MYLMNMNVTFETAYRRLTTLERSFVDDFVLQIEQQAERSGRPMMDVLQSITVDQYGPRERDMLSRQLVCVAVSDRVRDLMEAQNISARRIVKELSYLAFSSIDHFRRPDAMLADGGAFELDYATPEQRAAVREVETDEAPRTGIIKTKIKLHDKLGALRMLGQIRGLFNGDGDPINPERWAAEGGIPSDASEESAEDRYRRLVDGQ